MRKTQRETEKGRAGRLRQRKSQNKTEAAAKEKTHFMARTAFFF